jgi:hypothetical protein
LEADDKVYAVTAGYFVSMKEGNISEQRMEFVRKENIMDCAVLQLHSPAGTTLTTSICCFNPWCMDDDFQANGRVLSSIEEALARWVTER